jgi:hypothetical protein
MKEYRNKADSTNENDVETEEDLGKVEWVREFGTGLSVYRMK